MANIASLSVSIFAKTSAFTKGMRRVNRTLRELRGMAFNTSTALVALATGGGFAILLKNQAEAIDQTTKLSQRLNVSTRSLIAFNEIAGDTGASSEQVAKSLEILAKNAGLAAGGGGAKQLKVFEALGIGIEQLRTASPDQLMQQVASGLNRISDVNTRVAATQVLFGKSGTRILNFLRALPSDFAAADQQMRAFGVSLSELEAAKIEQARIALDDVRDLMQGIATQTLIFISGPLQLLAQKFTESAVAGETIGDRVQGALRGIVEWIAKAADILSLFKAGWAALKGTIAVVATAIGLVISGLAHGAQAIVNFLNPGEDVDLTSGIDNFLETMMDQISETGQDFREAITDFSDNRNLTSVSKFFDDANALSKASAEKAIADRKAIAGAELKLADDVFKSGAGKVSDFKQIDLRRTVIGGAAGANRKMTVTDPENKITNTLLRQMNATLKGGAYVLTLG